MKRAPESVESKIDMTPMIDIVFQLLIFFIMSFKIVTPEGDFSVKMPMAPQASTPEEQKDEEDLPPVSVRLKSTSDGRLAEVSCGQRVLGNGEAGLMELRKYVLSQVAPNGGPPNPKSAAKQEVELNCDYRLKYENVIACISYVTGYKQNGEVIRIAEKIKFAAPFGN